MVSPTLQSFGGFGEAVVACSMPKLCECPSLDSCQERFLWANKEFDSALHQVVGLELQVGDTKKFPQALGFRKPGSSSQVSVSKQGPWFTVTKEDGCDKRLVQLELACEADGVASQDPI